MYRYSIQKKRRVNKRVIIWIVSLFVLAGIIYALYCSQILQKLFEKKPVKIDEQEIGIICKENDTCFYINKDGIILKGAPNTSGSLIMVVKDYSKRSFGLGDTVLDKSFIETILIIKEDLLQKLGLKVLSFDIESYPAEKLRVVTSESWYILFSLKRNIKSQLLALKVALDEKIQNRMNLEYVDLRIENRIYYK